MRVETMRRTALANLVLLSLLLGIACSGGANFARNTQPAVHAKPTVFIQPTPRTSAQDEIRPGQPYSPTPVQYPHTVVVSSGPAGGGNPPGPAASIVASATTATTEPSQIGVLAASFIDVIRGWIAISTEGADGSAILTTADGGQHWSKQSNLKGQVSRLDFSTPEVGWAVADSSLLKTFDGGRSWTLENASNLPNITDVHFITPLEGWVSSGYRLLHTADGGRTWDTILNPCKGFFAGDPFSFISRSTGWIMCAAQPGAGSQFKTLFRTDNGGRSWQEISQTTPVKDDGSGAPAGLPITGYASDIFFLDARRGWLAENRGPLLWTTDGGQTWEQDTGLGNREDFERGVEFVSPDSGFLVGSSSGLADLRETHNGGVTWSTVFPL
jgi:photosystem II stability/assembly factor-like uncharacterized protein